MEKLMKNLVSHNDPKSPISEAFRTLRTNIQYASRGNQVKTLLVTSSSMGEGKSTISANLATVFAQQGKSVLLIDADMRRGKLNRIFDINTNNGLSNYLADVDWDENTLINRTNVENLFVIASGRVPPNPSELLSSDRMTDLLEQCRRQFDVVILDGPPCLVVADGLILARYVDSTILVASYKETKKDDLKNTKKAIENVGGKIGGVVLNKYSPQSEYKHGYKYYSYYSSDNEGR